MISPAALDKHSYAHPLLAIRRRTGLVCDPAHRQGTVNAGLSLAQDASFQKVQHAVGDPHHFSLAIAMVAWQAYELTRPLPLSRKFRAGDR